ncbi:ecotropic viral integration site 5 protein homolog isoform X1 [Astyanax mexicanus]|uniref:ecotropic viral integration site 5 protein homolog isoform X1 n=1 Tax=Astyanax mexicanus TaxID=7994 RepID=UPI0020CAAE28|nr:ecotropic viral integration site 5 protein homolog isoform X1 [Astyanax mexicanus]XP_022534315.2 ecotropic viral integration site 5 protein homolog isoform X1 [Astyanax mexicanus]XP_022534316.2 ecotropic viral integration site 5 protein homolog isoform X1 [Astyanax mexicanus]
MDTLSVPTPVSSHMSQLSPDEQKLLAKLEEQNRLLETDSKSLYSVSGVLRSPSSLRIFSFEEDSSEWGSVVENWEKWSKKKVKQLKEMIRKGIHPHFRPTVWQMLCNSHSLSVQEQYTELLQNTSPSEKLIQRDLSKLLPHHPLFQGLQDRLQQPLYNILKAYSVLDRDVGYHQGSVFIAGLLLMQMPEEQAFGVFVRLMQDFRLREIYRTHMVELGCCTFQLEGLIQEQLPDLYSHFRTQAFKTSTFSSSWFLTLFLSCLPLTAANRVFDIFMCEGLDIVFRVGLAILQLTETELMKLDAEGMTQFLEKTAPQLMNSNPEQMIATAYQIKYDSKRMKKLEKEYTAMKVKEMEEQEEIKKLQSENKVLRHRIDTLEKRQDEEAVWRLGQEAVQIRLKEAELQRVLKQMEIKMLLMEKSISVPEDSSVDLHEQLVSGKLREADTLIELQEVRNHLKDMEEKWQSQQKSRGSSGSDLQGELMSVRFREAHAQLQLTQNRRRLLQLQTQDQINSLQMKRITERMHSQRERLQELTMQNQRQRSLLGKTTEEEPRKQDCDEEQDDGASTARRLQDQIAELQAQIQTLSRQKRSTRL